MPPQPRTQKQVAEKYKGNLSYFRKPHAMRLLRLGAFTLAVVGSLGAVLGFRYYGERKLTFFSTGPISANHARFANQCDVCHEGAQPDLVEALRLEPAARALANPTKVDWKGNAAALQNTVLNYLEERPLLKARQEITRKLVESGSLTRFDRACIHCHEPQQLHQPQAVALGLRKVSPEIEIVHAGSCSNCHQEHRGPQKMAAPPPSNCEDCHANEKRLRENFTLVPTGAPALPKTGQIVDFGDGLRRFFAFRPTPHEPSLIKSFAQGHPDFGYQQPGSRDTALISYNHQRHEQPDVTLENRKLACADCHKPGADGAFMQPVRYQDHCARCHSLQIDPDLPKLLVPHRDPDKVHDFLHSLTAQYLDYIKTNEPTITTSDQAKAYIRTQFEKMNRRGYDSVEALERAVFRTGEPPMATRVTSKSNKAQIFPGCAKCHEGVQGPPAQAGWVIPKTAMAERWLTRGPFTHAPHQHILCADCHVAALTSTKTTDILLPARQNCAECHRQLDRSKTEALDAREPKAGPALAAEQRREGGVAADCQLCHGRYHATGPSIDFVKSVEGKTTAAAPR